VEPAIQNEGEVRTAGVQKDDLFLSAPGFRQLPLDEKSQNFPHRGTHGFSILFIRYILE